MLEKKLGNVQWGFCVNKLGALRPGGETGRRTGLKIPGPERGVTVRFRPRAPLNPAVECREPRLARLNGSIWFWNCFPVDLVHLNFVTTQHDAHFFFDVGEVGGVFLDGSSSAKDAERFDIQHFALLAIAWACSSAALKRRSR